MKKRSVALHIPSRSEIELIDQIVDSYREPSLYGAIERFRDHVLTEFIGAMKQGQPLNGLIHSVKYRMKDPTQLKKKLIRKLVEVRTVNKPFKITLSNFQKRITDLAGCRILHLNTRQMGQIHPILLRLFRDQQWELAEKPFVYVWDPEWKAYFESIQIKTRPSPRLYSSVHYVVRANLRNNIACEIQVRTLADEIWGEVDHLLNYPTRHESVACREQLASLARLTSACGRLVDSVMVSDHEWNQNPRRRSAEIARLSHQPKRGSTPRQA
jgi:putative GTP pyrophosphokinase